MDKIYVNDLGVKERVKNAKEQLAIQRNLLRQIQNGVSALTDVWSDQTQREYTVKITAMQKESLEYIEKIEAFLNEVSGIADKCASVDSTGRI